MARAPRGVERDGNNRRVAIQRRASWIFLITFPALALAGVFGTGPLSGGTASYAGEAFTADVHFARFARATADHQLSMTVRRQDLAAGTIQLTVPYAFLEQIMISQITPDAESRTLAPSGINYEWTVEAGVARTTISFVYKPGSLGR